LMLCDLRILRCLTATPSKISLNLVAFP